jgi:hypothetical protein
MGRSRRGQIGNDYPFSVRDYLSCDLARVTRDRATAGRLWPGDRNAFRRAYAAGHESLIDLYRLA